MTRDHLAYWIGRGADLRQIPGCKELNVSHDFFVGACKVARWHSTRDERDAARRERERKETLAWAYATAEERLKAQGEIAMAFAQNARREAREMREAEANSRRNWRKMKSARMAAMWAAKRKKDLTAPSGGGQAAENPKATLANSVHGAR